MCAMPLLWILCLLAHSISASKLNVPRETGNCGEEPPRYNDMIRANTHRVASQPLKSAGHHRRAFACTDETCGSICGKYFFGNALLELHDHYNRPIVL